jgi:hypothetical protein
MLTHKTSEYLNFDGTEPPRSSGTVLQLNIARLGIAPARLNDELIAEWRIAEYKPGFGRMLARVACVVTHRDGPVVIERTMCGLHISAQRPMRAGSDRAVPHTLARSRALSYSG